MFAVCVGENVRALQRHLRALFSITASKKEIIHSRSALNRPQ